MASLLKTPPRIPEILFAAILIWMFASGQGWTVLLSDGDTGWHIRNGERILDTRSVPHSDAFSFGADGHSWFAWEWLSDVLFAGLFRWGGLRAVSMFCGIVIAAAVSVMFRHLVWRSVGMAIAFPLALVSVGASSIHFLARPHVIGLLLFAIVAWMIDRERAASARSTWILPALFLLWVNCHGSFLAGLALLGLWLGERILRIKDGRRILKPVIVVAACGVVTFCNPYGWRLHAHAVEYLRSGWIQANVEEFQSPHFRSESMLQFEILLVSGLAAIPWLIRRREFYPGCVILLWAHESLSSVRHVPLYCLAAGPFLGSWVQHHWDRTVRTSAQDSLLRVVNAIDATWRPWNRGYTVWPLVLCLALSAFSSKSGIGFPANKFPVALMERNATRFSVASPGRVFSSDQWSDYLIFRFYPGVHVYFDGRSDFFGPWRGASYQKLMGGAADSADLLAREQIAWALVPKDWALSAILTVDARWRMVDEDAQAILFTRNSVETAFHPNQKSPAVR